MRRAVSAILALLMALWAAIVVRFTNGIPVLWCAFVALIFPASACAPVTGMAGVSAASEPRTPDTSGVIRLVGNGGFGQGCPFEKTLAYTARHMVVKEEPFPRNLFYVWSDHEGRSGSAWNAGYDLRRDLAVIHTDKPFHRIYPVATDAPQEGEPLTIVGYDLEDEDHPMRPKVVPVKLKNIVSAHLMLGKGGQQGFSGSCVLNAKGEIVGIFHWVVTPAMFKEFGVASAVYGEWGSVDWRPSE